MADRGFKAFYWPIHSIHNPGFIYIIDILVVAHGCKLKPSNCRPISQLKTMIVCTLNCRVHSAEALMIASRFDLLSMGCCWAFGTMDSSIEPTRFHT